MTEFCGEPALSVGLPERARAVAHSPRLAPDHITADYRDGAGAVHRAHHDVYVSGGGIVGAVGRRHDQHQGIPTTPMIIYSWRI